MTRSAGHAPFSSYTPTFALRLRKSRSTLRKKTENHRGDMNSEAMTVAFLYREPESKVESASQKLKGAERFLKVYMRCRDETQILDETETAEVSSSKITSSDEKVTTCLIRATSVWTGS